MFKIDQCLKYMEVLIQIDLFSLTEVQETVKSKKEAFERLNSVHLKGI